MELEQAKKFIQKKAEIYTQIKEYVPGETGYENLSPKARFDGLWTRFDDLAASAPGFDGVDREKINVRDADGVSLTVTRSYRTIEGRYREVKIRNIKAEWSTYTGNVLFSESLEDEFIGEKPSTFQENKLGTLEETEAAVRTMIDEHNQLMEFARLQDK